MHFQEWIKFLICQVFQEIKAIISSNSNKGKILIQLLYNLTHLEDKEIIKIIINSYQEDFKIWEI